MITLEASKPEFISNQNDCGPHQFLCLKRAVNPAGNPVYIYQRSHAEGRRMGTVACYEVFIPKVLKAGTVQKFPGKTVTIEEDTEIYPHGAETDFGKRAWSCSTLPRAEFKFNELMQRGLVVEEEENTEVSNEPYVPKSKAKLNLPEGEFSVKELAAFNSVEYPIAFVWLKDQLAMRIVKETRTERRAARGPETQLYKKSS